MPKITHTAEQLQDLLLERINRIPSLRGEDTDVNKGELIWMEAGEAKLNGLDPYAYLHDVLERLSTQAANRIDELLPHRWRPYQPDGDKMLRADGYEVSKH